MFGDLPQRSFDGWLSGLSEDPGLDRCIQYSISGPVLRSIQELREKSVK